MREDTDLPSQPSPGVQMRKPHARFSKAYCQEDTGGLQPGRNAGIYLSKHTGIKRTFAARNPGKVVPQGPLVRMLQLIPYHWSHGTAT